MAKRKSSIEQLPPGVSPDPQTTKPKPRAVDPPTPTIKPPPAYRTVTVEIPIVDEVRHHIPEFCNLGRLKRSRGETLKKIMGGMDASNTAVDDGGWKSGSVALNLILDRICEAIADAGK